MDKTIFGAFIAESRRSLGLTQRQLADALHVTDKAVSKWERGLSYPDVTLLEPLAQALGLTLTELMSCTPPAQASEKPREEQVMKDVLALSTDSVAATRKRGRRWIAVLSAVCLLLSAALILLTRPVPLSEALSLKWGTRIESVTVIQAGTADDGAPTTTQLDDSQILLLEACLRDGTARWRGFAEKRLVWSTGALYTLCVNYNNGHSDTCRILNGTLYTETCAYRLDINTSTVLAGMLESFTNPSLWVLPDGYTWEDSALLFWREGAYDTADLMMGHIYTSGEDTAALRRMVDGRTYFTDGDFTMSVMLRSDFLAGGAGKLIVDGIEYTYFDNGELYCDSAMQLAAEPLTSDELAFLRTLHSEE